MSETVSDSVRNEARRIVGAAWYRDTVADRIAYGRDCWPLGILWTRGGKVYLNNPDFIVRPGTVDEIVRLVELAKDNGVPLIPYGAGSGVCGGTVAFQGGFTVDLKRLSGIRRIDEAGLTVRAGTGTIGQHLETGLPRRGFTMGHYPSSLGCSTLGGYLAGRSAGQNSSRFGKIEDMCLSLEMVTGIGEVVETSRYRPDLTQIMIGSEGTFGVLTEATMRIEPAPEERVYRGFQFHSVAAALDAIREMIQAGYRPAVVRLYDEFDTVMAKRKHRSFSGVADDDIESLVSRLTRFARERAVEPLRPTLKRAASSLLKRALGTPLLLNKLGSMLPSGVLVICGFEGPEGVTRSEAAAALELLCRTGTDLGKEPGEYWYEHRMSVSYKQSPMMDQGAFVDTMEVSTTWHNLHNLYRAVREAVSPHAFIMAHFSHVYSEGSSIYFTFAGFAEDGAPIEALYKRTWSAALGAVRRVNASVAHHHGIGVSKAPYLHHDHVGGAHLNGLLKRRFDPAGIMNPGKLWDVPQAVHS